MWHAADEEVLSLNPVKGKLEEEWGDTCQIPERGKMISERCLEAERLQELAEGTSNAN